MLTATQAMIESTDLSVFYGAKQVLFDVNLAIPQGGVCALIGPSGCGKSTFLRALNRMNDTIPGARHTGTVNLDGISVHDPSIDVVALRKRVGMVFQKSIPFPQSVFENVAYGPRIHGERDRETLERIVERSLRQAALWEEVKDRLESSALGLSGGQQQRLCIARALATEPEVILMDEPASALDPGSTERIEDLIGQLKGRYTVVIVTHNMQQARRVSDRTAFFFEGTLIEVGQTDEVFGEAREQKTRDYVAGRFG